MPKEVLLDLLRQTLSARQLSPTPRIAQEEELVQSNALLAVQFQWLRRTPSGR
jgi:hypothetical protein